MKQQKNPKKKKNPEKRLSESVHETRMSERMVAPSGPGKKKTHHLPSKIASKIDKVSMKHFWFWWTSIFQQGKKKTCQQKYPSRSNSKGLSTSDACTNKLRWELSQSNYVSIGPHVNTVCRKTLHKIPDLSGVFFPLSLLKTFYSKYVKESTE